MENKYTAVVIGGGPGGYVCAIRLAQLGVKTALIERDKVGGTCLNRGCIPTKSLLQSAKVYKTAKEADMFGISCGEVTYDYAKIASRKDAVVSQLRRGVEGLVKGNHADLITGEAAFVDAHTLKVGDNTIAFDYAVIASGSRPANLGMGGIDSDGFLALDKLPKSAAIVGSGVIGMEFCTVLNTLGVEVDMYDVAPEILPGTDADIAAALRADMEKRGVRFHLGQKFDKDSCKAELIVTAVGRRPNTEELNLEAAGVKKNERGYIPVDDCCRTNVGNIFAIGDVNGRVMLAHAASAQGDAVAESIASGKDKKAEMKTIPSCIFTDPEIALIGYSEEKSKELGYDVITGVFNAAGNGKSMIAGETKGFVKVVADKRTHEVLGLRLFCGHATDLIGEGIAAIKLESTLEEIAAAVHPHPTVNEMIMEAFHDALGCCAHKIKR